MHIMKNLTEEIAKTDFLTEISHGNKDMICKLIVGALSWDLNLIFEALITEHTLELSFVLVNLYSLTKLKKLNGGEKIDLIEEGLRSLLYLIIPSICSASNANAILGGVKLESYFDSKFSAHIKDKKRDVPAISNILIERFNNALKLDSVEKPQDKKKNEKPIEAKSLFEMISSPFFDPKIGQVHDSQDEPIPVVENEPVLDHIMDLFKGVTDGSIFYRLVLKIEKMLNDKSKGKEDEKDFAKRKEVSPILGAILRPTIELLLRCIERFFTEKGKADDKKQEEATRNIVSAFVKLVQALADATKQPIWEKVSDVAPKVIEMFFAFQSNLSKAQPKAMKIEVMKLIISLMNSQMGDNSDQKVLVLDIMTLAFGTDLRSWPEKLKSGKKLDELKLTVDFTVQDRIRIFFNNILPSFFPGIKEYFPKADSFEKIIEIYNKFSTDFRNNMHDPQKVKDLFIYIIPLLSEFKIMPPTIGKPLIAILDGKVQDAKGLIPLLFPDNPKKIEQIQKNLEILITFKEILNGNFDSLNQIALPPSIMAQKEEANSNDAWVEIMKKIKEGTATPKDLFIAVDQAGDKSGSISEEEFLGLARRLGLQLSNHRVKEIFAKVKGKKVKDASASLDLNEKEFAKAMEYLQSKNLLQALSALGITPEILTAILIRLIILLLLIFVFIFLGISSFALGGTFGAIINSCFPAAGGAGLGKKSDADKNKLNDENVGNAAENSMAVTSTQQL